MKEGEWVGGKSTWAVFCPTKCRWPHIWSWRRDPHPGFLTSTQSTLHLTTFQGMLWSWLFTRHNYSSRSAVMDTTIKLSELATFGFFPLSFSVIHPSAVLSDTLSCRAQRWFFSEAITMTHHSPENDKHFYLILVLGTMVLLFFPPLVNHNYSWDCVHWGKIPDLLNFCAHAHSWHSYTSFTYVMNGFFMLYDIISNYLQITSAGLIKYCSSFQVLILLLLVAQLWLNAAGSDSLRQERALNSGPHCIQLMF